MKSSRRGFIRGLAGISAVGAGGCFTFGKGGKIRLAAVGVGGKGFSDWLPMLESGKAELVALCDADKDQLFQAQARLQKLKKPYNIMKIPFFQDYRQLIDAIADGKIKVDAMTVSTPDHSHAAIAISAMKLGIHVYVQKPLVRTLGELDYFNKVARDYGVITQLGNQGSALSSMRRCTEIVQSGVLGDVTEVHVWTNRPVWPQGLKAAATTKGPAMAIPSTLDWSAWLSVAQDRPYRGKISSELKGYDPWNLCANVYHPFSWRAFYDFGCGAFGDMACHTMNMAFRGLELGVVSSAECVLIEEKNDIAYPTKSTVKLVYAARDSKVRPGVKLPECTLYWYDGNQQPSADIMPEVVNTFKKVPQTGCYIIGTKGCVIMQDDYGGKCAMALKGEKTVLDVFKHEATAAIERRIPFRLDAKDSLAVKSGAAAVSADGHYVEFLDAINGDGPVYAETNSRCYADIDYSIPLMEGILVGCMAQRIPGKLKWDAKAQRFDVAAANELIKPYIRKGFEF
ncbi:MAG: Gfo/Idh/MocA family oxidoreductase [Kiritimatiellae bacterium]|nr:Gfo/Idh/MocA family oxidoreductase [Kiritimatiellia bacterium]